MKFTAALVVTAALALALPAGAQNGPPGAADASRVQAGSYKVDPHHTQVVWTINHMGFSPLSGAFAANGGTLEMDPAKPAAAKVSVTFATNEMTTSVPAFTQHLSSADFFDVAKFPSASFTSTAVRVTGQTAKVTGNLTIKGVTKPVTFDAKFYGAGTNPMSKKLTIGFSGTTTIKRSDFGLTFGAPVVGDNVELQINAAFERS